MFDATQQAGGQSEEGCCSPLLLRLSSELDRVTTGTLKRREPPLVGNLCSCCSTSLHLAPILRLFLAGTAGTRGFLTGEQYADPVTGFCCAESLLDLNCRSNDTTPGLGVSGCGPFGACRLFLFFLWVSVSQNLGCWPLTGLLRKLYPCSCCACVVFGRFVLCVCSLHSNRSPVGFRLLLVLNFILLSHERTRAIKCS